jgi:opine dehydrogenase
MMRIAVLGGGNGAHAMAADLALAGHEIRLAELPVFEEAIAAIRALKGILSTASPQ